MTGVERKDIKYEKIIEYKASEEIRTEKYKQKVWSEGKKWKKKSCEKSENIYDGEKTGKYKDEARLFAFFILWKWGWRTL